jgi:hypothetical protein
MGMLTDHELTASFLAGGLGGVRERFERALGRVRDSRPQDAQDDPETMSAGCRSPSYAAAVSQALSDLADAWQRLPLRTVRFRETERLLQLLKDRALEALRHDPHLRSDYHRLAQCLNELKLDNPHKPELRF